MLKNIKCKFSIPFTQFSTEISTAESGLIRQVVVFVIGAVYRPPKPTYQESELFLAIEDSIEQFSSMPEVTFVTLANNFNQLSHTYVELLGLMAEFHEPKHARQSSLSG